ncbi:tyrosine-type recombinase/integrase [Nonomuraea jabiensis]|uniref:tyrosine-type recombinase/integrase n=1 Tax=Nonomuraea jabiensis TaxID=882448 RepID=UPI003D735396
MRPGRTDGTSIRRHGSSLRIRRAGVPVVGAHQLRHRAASQVLAQGGNLTEAAQLLRHQSEETTAIYAKVDQAALAVVVRPWPTAGER